ncbi:hypothetical protein [Capnocytophaga leadbetteri]|uniref:hypothetical protein n=1 Tax=Capnocytophaga leadbetteri TaxID=327575 RepID=UPI0028EE9FFD|nr:hypothetical protein [Capnocytophaga leadbetteri]
MKRIVWCMTLIAAIVAGCGNSKNAVAYSVAQNYFVNNTFGNKEVETLKIDSQEEFDRIFGMATTMGSKPTAINFKTQSVLAIIVPASEKETIIRIRALETTLTNGILVKYTVEKGRDLGYTAQAAQILLVNKTDKEVQFADYY